jgi:hypothetical protein
MTDAATPTPAPVSAQRFVPLEDLALAPENIRFNEPADEDQDQPAPGEGPESEPGEAIAPEDRLETEDDPSADGDGETLVQAAA